MYLKKVLLFTPIFLFLYGINSYNMHLSLFEDPFGQIASEEWVKESPIQFFIGYVLNLILNDTILTYWSVVVLGFIFLLFSIIKFDQKVFANMQVMKILYFSPFFIILFYWMGKPDTFTIGSLFLLTSFSSSLLISGLAIFIMIFSHPQISFIYLILLKFLKIFKFKIEHYILFLLGYITYFIYYSQLEEFDDRYDIISNEIDRAVNTVFTNTLAGFISLFMWLWIPIFLSGLVKDKKFILSFLLIFFISFFTLDHTRIFMILSIPIIIYLTSKRKFLESFSTIFEKRIMYVLGLFQIQKRADGRIVDGNNLSENTTFQDLFSEFLNFINKII